MTTQNDAVEFYRKGMAVLLVLNPFDSGRDNMTGICEILESSPTYLGMNRCRPSDLAGLQNLPAYAGLFYGLTSLSLQGKTTWQNLRAVLISLYGKERDSQLGGKEIALGQNTGASLFAILPPETAKIQKEAPLLGAIMAGIEYLDEAIQSVLLKYPADIRSRLEEFANRLEVEVRFLIWGDEEPNFEEV